jgi:hypothetical protein
MKQKGRLYMKSAIISIMMLCMMAAVAFAGDANLTVTVKFNGVPQAGATVTVIDSLNNQYSQNTNAYGGTTFIGIEHGKAYVHAYKQIYGVNKEDTQYPRLNPGSNTVTLNLHDPD